MLESSPGVKHVAKGSVFFSIVPCFGVLTRKLRGMPLRQVGDPVPFAIGFLVQKVQQVVVGPRDNPLLPKKFVSMKVLNQKDTTKVQAHFATNYRALLKWIFPLFCAAFVRMPCPKHLEINPTDLKRFFFKSMRARRCAKHHDDQRNLA